MKPKRIQRKRTKGWRMPANTVYVGRPTRWGNPYTLPIDGWTRTTAVLSYRNTVLAAPWFVAQIQRELRGKDLACWCPIDAECHADVLLEIANERIDP